MTFKPPEYEILITKAENGYILSRNDWEDDDIITKHRRIVEGITELLYEIADYFGYPYDKFSHENLSVTWDKSGHKVEGEVAEEVSEKEWLDGKRKWTKAQLVAEQRERKTNQR